MNTTTLHRRIASGVVAAVACSMFVACGSETSPAQDIGRDHTEKQDRTAPMPTRTTGNRFDFDDEYGSTKLRQRKARPAGSGTRNRMDFRDDGR